MVRPLSGYRLFFACSFVIGSVALAAGCTSALTTAMYLMGANDIPAEYKGLKAKKIAVVCRPVAAVAFRDTGVAHDLATEVNRLLAKNVSKVEMVDQQKVAAWLDERYDGDYSFPEAGEAFEADMVLGIELQDFGLHMGQTLYQGTANVHIVLHDMRDGQRVVFERDLPQIAWPPNGGIETSERQEIQFRREFIRVIGDRIGRYFYAHDPASNFALDAAAMQ